MKRRNTRDTRNGVVAAQLEDVRVCVAHLARGGAEIVGILLSRSAPPVIKIERPPRGIKGSTKRIEGRAYRRIETLAAVVDGCQVEWRVTV